MSKVRSKESSISKKPKSEKQKKRSWWSKIACCATDATSAGINQKDVEAIPKRREKYSEEAIKLQM